MPASYPSLVKTWANKQDLIDDVFAGDVNGAYAEIIAIEDELLRSYEGKRITINNPYRFGGSLSLKGQLHCHTTNSDGVDTPLALVTAYKNAGFDFITITDHDFVTPDPAVVGITWLGNGVEENYYGRHLVAYDIEEQNTTADMQESINFHHSRGKLSNIAHPDWPAGYTMDENELSTYYDFNFVEVYNLYLAETQWDYALSSGKKVFGISVDDCHDIAGALFNKGWVVVHTDGNTKAAILASLRDGNFYASTGNDIAISVAGKTITATSIGLSNFTFIGRNGRVLKTENGVLTSSYTVLGDELYVRVKSVKVADSLIAWSQPIFIDVLGDDSEVLSKIKKQGYPKHMFEQALINGNFDIWQRGTSAVNANGVSGTGYVADRWNNFHDAAGGTLPNRIDRRIVVASNTKLQGSYYGYEINVDGAGANLGASAYAWIRQKIEHGTRYLCGLGKKVTVSFWAKSDIPNKKIGIFLQQSYGTGGTPSAIETINGVNWVLTSDWKKYVYTFTTNTLMNKVFGTNDDDFLQVTIIYQWGDTYKVRVGDSVPETYVGAGNIDIAQAKLNVGDIALPFNPKTYAEELNDCQRFFQLRSTNNIDVLDLRPNMAKTPTITGSVSPFAYHADFA